MEISGIGETSMGDAIRRRRLGAKNEMERLLPARRSSKHTTSAKMGDKRRGGMADRSE